MMDGIRDTRPWFWVLVAALAVLGVVALVLAISAGNEGVDQKKAVAEATEQIESEVSGLETALDSANELQEESEESAAQDRQQIKREVNVAVAEGEEQLQKLKKRTAALEEEVTIGSEEVEKLAKGNSKLTSEQAALKKSNARLTGELEAVAEEVEELDEELATISGSKNK